MRYGYFCDGECQGRTFTEDRPMGEQRTHPPCPVCGGTNTRRNYGGQTLMVRGEIQGNYEPSKKCSAPPGVSPTRLEEGYKRHVQQCRLEAKRNARARKLMKQKDGHFRHRASVPIEYHRAVQASEGFHYWQDNPKEKLKKHGFWFDD